MPGVASAEIPVHDSWIEALRSRFRGRPESLVVVPWAHVHVYASEADEGRASFYLSLVNMMRRPVRIERLNLEQFLIAGISATVAAPLFTPPKEPVPALGIKELYFDLALGAPAIRQLVQRIQQAQNLFSSPGIELTCAGSVDLMVRKRSVRVAFSVVIRTPEVRLSEPALRGA